MYRRYTAVHTCTIGTPMGTYSCKYLGTTGTCTIVHVDLDTDLDSLSFLTGFAGDISSLLNLVLVLSKVLI